MLSKKNISSRKIKSEKLKSVYDNCTKKDENISGKIKVV